MIKFSKRELELLIVMVVAFKDLELFFKVPIDEYDKIRDKIIEEWSKRK